MADDHLPYLGQPVQILPANTFAQSGVYFLHLAGEVVYVGQAVNMRKRIGQHLAEGVKEFDAVSYVACPTRQLNAVELHFIIRLLPRYNQCNRSNRVREMVAAGWSYEHTHRPEGVPLLDPEEAAAFVGMTVHELEALGRKGPPRVMRRNTQTRSRYCMYALEDLMKFAQLHS